MATSAQLLAALEAKMESRFREQEEIINSLRERVQSLERQITIVRSKTGTDCCDPITHWKDFVRRSQRSHLLDIVKDYHEQYQYEVDGYDMALEDDDGNPLHRSADECWLVNSLVEERVFNLDHTMKYTCPELGYDVLLTMSAYKLIALMRYDADAPEVQMALEGILEASHLCNSGPCVNEAHIVLETKQRNLARKGHQSGREPCDCDIPCLQNGLVWYPGEAPGIAAAPHHKAAIEYY